MRRHALSLWERAGVRASARTFTLTLTLSLKGEGWGEGEHTAVVVIPFTSCSLLLCNDIACERARVAQSPPPWQPGPTPPL